MLKTDLLNCKSTHNFISYFPSGNKNTFDSITETSIAAEKLGMSYGKYVSLYGVVKESEKFEKK